MRGLPQFSLSHRLLVLLLGCGWYLAIATGAQAQNRVGAISEVAGVAHVKRATQNLDVAPAMPVELHDLVTTEPAAHLTITMLDNSKLGVGPASSLTIDEHVVGGGARTRTKVSLFGGSLRSIVSTTLHGAPTFEVHTPNAIAGVRGTDFLMFYTIGVTRPEYPGCGQFTDIRVNEGVVAFWNPLAASTTAVLVTAGFEASSPCSSAPLAAALAGLTGAFNGMGADSGNNSPPPGTGGAPPPSCPVCPIH
jgi:hypothetical protein